MTTKFCNLSSLKLIPRMNNMSSWKSAQVLPKIPTSPPASHLRTYSRSNVLITQQSQWRRDVSASLPPSSYCLCNSRITYQHQQLRTLRTSLVKLKKPWEAEEEQEVAGKGEKVLHLKLASTRVDAVLKSGLSISRNKIEKVFYDDRVRVNGERPKKKSQELFEGDEVDVVRGYNSLNPENFIDVSRIEIIKIGDHADKGDEDSDDNASDDDDQKGKSKINVVLRRSKILTIRNYKPAWKGSSSSDS
ncbi:unnamed protein product [Orchesella dallaii]|uniref:Mitochondrial transcription rescue factor 1 C-terminal domain-containing protein n=1 Tax=Orchesella dallaii TaxID=48710 RepID=A0ABP1RVF5_9HEXA